METNINKLLKDMQKLSTAEEVRRLINCYSLDKTGKVTAISLSNEHKNAKNLSRLILDEEAVALQYINISGIETLREIVFRAALPELIYADFSRCKLTEITLPPGFLKLEQLYLHNNQLQQITFQGACPKMILLDLANNQLTDFSLPAGFEKLAYLYLPDNKLKSLQLPSDAGRLNTLHLRNNKLDDLPENLVGFSDMEVLYLHGNPLLKLPKQIISEDERASSWEAVRSYLQELGKAAIINDRAKLIIVGNGRVGKTSMYRRLKGLPFRKNEPYTHGVQLGLLEKKNLTEVKTDKLNLTVWDFGGQDIFYATHQFFLSEEAVYLLAWTNEENVEPHRLSENERLSFNEKWRSCDYWLDNIRLYSAAGPLLMVQTNSDLPATQLVFNPEWGKEPFNARSLSFSAAKDYGLPELKNHLVHLLNNSMPLLGKEFPKSYDTVIKSLKKQNVPYITFKDFKIICEKSQITKGNEKELLKFLNNAGVVVYFDSPLLNDTIYIDPNWLTRMVYGLINNKLRKLNGIIDEDYLNDALNVLTAKEKEQFVTLLQKFELIFKRSGDSPPTYIAPQYLPECLSYNEKSFYSSAKERLSRVFTFRFTKFVPENLMINFLSRYGPFSNNVYWKHGIYFNYERQECIVELTLEGEILEVYAGNGLETYDLQQRICNAFVELGKNAQAEISLDNNIWVSWQELKKQFHEFSSEPNHQFFASDGYTKVYLKDYLHFFQAEKSIIDPPEKPSPEIFFSYAWGDQEEKGESREKIANDLYESLKRQDYNVKRDKEEIGYKMSITDFMKRISKGSFVVAIISDKYLKSPYCMFELLETYRKSNSDAEEFKAKIFPLVLEDAKIHSPISKLDYQLYWNNKLDELRNKINQIGWENAGESINEYDKLKEIAVNVVKLIQIFQDINTMNPAMLKENSFEIIRNSIEERIMSSQV